MTPQQLRAKSGVGLAAVARALGISVPSLRILEATPTGSWTLYQLGRYAAACGRSLVVLAESDDGHGEELS